jgi:hypothetical protein
MAEGKKGGAEQAARFKQYDYKAVSVFMAHHPRSMSAFGTCVSTCFTSCEAVGWRVYLCLLFEHSESVLRVFRPLPVSSTSCSLNLHGHYCVRVA